MDERIAFDEGAATDLRELFAARKAAEAAFAAADRELMLYAHGLLRGRGIDPVRLAGIDFDTAELVVNEEPKDDSERA